MAPKTPKFFKIVLQHNIESSNLKLPPKFTREYSGELAAVAQLVVSDGQIWRVGLRRDGDQFYLSNGFDQFARHYSLCHGHLLVFEFKGMSCFGVSIYDQTNCQISHNPNTLEEERNAAPAFGSAPNNQRSNSRPEKSDFEYISKCGIPSPAHFRSTRPYFEVLLNKSNLDHYGVYVPREILKAIGEAQLEKRFIWLETGDQRRWKVSLLDNRFGRMLLGRVAKFYKDNQLKENDICIFELVKEDLLKVFIFSAI